LEVHQRLGIPTDDRGSVAGEALQQVIQSTANLRDLLVGQGPWIEVRNRSRSAVAETAEGTRRPWALAALDHGRALLAEPADAPALFENALTQHAASRARLYDRARTRLAYGEFLRRTQRRVDAGTHLRSALEIFADLNAQPLVARATQELRASGETARKRDPSTALKLTPMERQVAQLVGQGLSNKDIAVQCWVSPPCSR
jgi:ATP/maltotriose-dependent transcriptional regulator MalT